MAGRLKTAKTPRCEIVEAQGHLIDSHIMERIFDAVVEAGGRFEVEQFSIDRKLSLRFGTEKRGKQRHTWIAGCKSGQMRKPAPAHRLANTAELKRHALLGPRSHRHPCDIVPD
jgi:hypothetical protein